VKGPVSCRCPGEETRPRQDSNLRTPLRRRVLYPLSYGGSGRRTQYQPVREATDVRDTAYRHDIDIAPTGA
jgi:hypothetical protein